MSGPPLHRHAREDEWLYVLDGEITAQIDGAQTVLYQGGSAFIARSIVHTFQNFNQATAHLLVLVSPGGFNRFFDELSLLNKGLATPDLIQSEHLRISIGSN